VKIFSFNIGEQYVTVFSSPSSSASSFIIIIQESYTVIFNQSNRMGGSGLATLTKTEKCTAMYLLLRSI